MQRKKLNIKASPTNLKSDKKKHNILAYFKPELFAVSLASLLW